MHRRDPQTGAWVADERVSEEEDVASDEFQAIEEDAKAQIRQLRDDRARLALPALSDEKVRIELEDVESRMRSAEKALERVGLARTERARLDAEARRTAEEKRRAAARAAASKLLGKRLDAMKQFDEAARQLAQAIAACEGLSVEADLKLQEAGGRPGEGMLGQGAYERALRAAFASAGVSGRCIAFEGAAPGRLGPLAPEQ